MKFKTTNSIYKVLVAGLAVCVSGSVKYADSISFAAAHDCSYMVQGTTVPNTSGQPVVIDDLTGTVISANFFNSGAIDTPYFDGLEFVSVCINPPNRSGQVTATIESDVGRDDDATIKGYPQFVFGSKFGNQFETSFRYYNNSGLEREHQWPVVASNLSDVGYPFEFANLEYISRVKGIGLPAFTSSLPDINVELNISEFNIQGAERDVMLESWFYDTAANAEIIGVDAVSGLPIAGTLNNIVGVGHPHYGQVGNLLLEMMVHLGPLSPNDISAATRNPGKHQLTENYSGRDHDGDGIDDHFDVDSHVNFGSGRHPNPGLYSSGEDANGDGIDDADILPVTIGNYQYSIWYGTTHLTPLVIFSRETDSSLRHNYGSNAPEMDLSSEGRISLGWNSFLNFTLNDIESMLQAANVEWVQDERNPFPRMRGSGGAIGGLEIGVEPQTNAPADLPYKLVFNELSVMVDGVELGLLEIPPPTPVQQLVSPVGHIDQSPIEFSWVSIEHAAEYRIYLANSDAGETTFISPWISSVELGCNDTGSVCSYSNEHVLTGDNRWRVRARNTAGHSSWSDRADFNVNELGPPESVTRLLSPLGSGWDNNPGFQWERVPYADSYRLYIADSNSGEADSLSGWIGVQELGCAEYPVCTYSGSLNLSGVKRWRVRASNESGQSAWSARGDFSAALPLDGIPELISPVGDQEVSPTTLVWHAVDDAAEYRVLVVDVDSGEEQIYSSWILSEDLGCLSDGICRFTFPGEIVGRKKWRVRARNKYGSTEWSSRADFSVVVSFAPEVVTNMISPIGEQSVPPDVLRWQGVRGATLYRILLVDINSAGQELLSQWISAVDLGCAVGGECLYSLPPISDGRKKWRIKARNTFGDSDWSEKRVYSH